MKIIVDPKKEQRLLNRWLSGRQRRKSVNVFFVAIQKGRWDLLRRILFLLILVAIGCTESSLEVSPENRLVFPERFESDGQSWTRTEEVKESDNQTLEQFFQKNPSLSEEPVFLEKPVIYLDSKKTKRFYWIAEQVSSVYWICVEIRGKQVSHFDGQETPFPSP